MYAPAGSSRQCQHALIVYLDCNVHVSKLYLFCTSFRKNRFHGTMNFSNFLWYHFI